MTTFTGIVYYKDGKEVKKMSEEEYIELLDLFRENNLTQYGIDKLYGEIIDRQIEKNKEIEKLNNIINELEKSIDDKLKEFEDDKDYLIDGTTLKDLKNELQELKGSN